MKYLRPNNRHRHNAGCPYCAGQRADNNRSLLILNPALSKEWHPIKNNGLTPCQVEAGTTKKVWWRCEQKHEWNATVASRYKQNVGCPYCSNHKVCVENCLATIRPDLISQWHPTKNGITTPYTITTKSHAWIWWQCNKNHSWKRPLQWIRKTNNCPVCYKKQVSETYCLAAINPTIAKEWHPTKNKSSPYDVMPNSGINAWWKCNEAHEWQAKISDRNNGNGCPYCAGRKATNDNNFLVEFPLLAKEWHPTKNNKLFPVQVRSGSGRVVWWLSECGHEWQETIINRTRSPNRGCPYCCGRSNNSLRQQYVTNHINQFKPYLKDMPQDCWLIIMNQCGIFTDKRSANVLNLFHAGKFSLNDLVEAVTNDDVEVAQQDFIETFKEKPDVIKLSRMFDTCLEAGFDDEAIKAIESILLAKLWDLEYRRQVKIKVA